jgi:anti-anti-sigma factor
MIGSNIENNGDRTVVKFYGDLTVENAARMKALLMESIKARGHFSIDLAGIDSADVAGLQLLCAAHKAYRSGNNHSSFLEGASEAFKKVVRDSGYTRKEGCMPETPGQCLWIGGETDG